MPEQVKVDDLEVFRRFRAALLKFAQAAEQSLAGADSEIAGTRMWLENEQTTHWQNQLRKRTELATQARDAVRHKKLFKDASGKTPSAVVEEKELAKCMALLEQAQQKVEAVRKSLPRLEKAAELYRGGVARLGGTIGEVVPQAVARLDRLAARLEEYVQIEAPASMKVESTAPSAFEGSVSRGDDVPMEAPVKMEAATPADATPAAEAGPVVETKEAANKEGADVADG